MRETELETVEATAMTRSVSVCQTDRRTDLFAEIDKKRKMNFAGSTLSIISQDLRRLQKVSIIFY